MVESYLLVFLGAGLGGALRHGVNRAADAWLGSGFPFGTLFVNVAGSLAMGVLAGLFLARTGTDQHLRLFLTTGLLGGFTTFSAFSLEAALMVQRNDYAALAFYAGGSVLLSILALFAGLQVVRTLI